MVTLHVFLRRKSTEQIHTFSTSRAVDARLNTKRILRMETELIADLLLGPGETLQGSGLGDSELLNSAQAVFLGRRFCILRNWMLIDVMLGDDVERRLKNLGLFPTLVFGRSVVFDSAVAHARTGAIRSGYQRKFYGCYFESDDAVFILGGPGLRKYSSLPALLALDAC